MNPGANRKNSEHSDTLRTLHEESLPFAELRFADSEQYRLEILRSHLHHIEKLLSTHEENVCSLTNRLSDLNQQTAQVTENVLHDQETLDSVNRGLESSLNRSHTTLRSLKATLSSLAKDSNDAIAIAVNELEPPILLSDDGHPCDREISMFIGHCRNLMNQCRQVSSKDQLETVCTIESQLTELAAAFEEQLSHLKSKRDIQLQQRKSGASLVSLNAETLMHSIDLKEAKEKVYEMQTEISYQTLSFDEQIETFSRSVKNLEEHVFGSPSSGPATSYGPHNVFTRYKTVRGFIDLLIGKRPKNPRRSNLSR